MARTALCNFVIVRYFYDGYSFLYRSGFQNEKDLPESFTFLVFFLFLHTYCTQFAVSRNKYPSFMCFSNRAIFCNHPGTPYLSRRRASFSNSLSVKHQRSTMLHISIYTNIIFVSAFSSSLSLLFYSTPCDKLCLSKF